MKWHEKCLFIQADTNPETISNRRHCQGIGTAHRKAGRVSGLKACTHKHPCGKDEF